MSSSRTENGQIPLMLIHGAWLSARSWEHYVDYFGKRGFAVSAPEWPRKQGDVEEMRETAEQSAGLRNRGSRSSPSSCRISCTAPSRARRERCDPRRRRRSEAVPAPRS